MLVGHGLELGDVQRRQDCAQRDHPRRPGLATRPGRRFHRIAGVEQNRAALLHIGVDARERLRRRLRRIGDDRPVDEREESKLIARNVQSGRLAGLQRGALREKDGQALQPRFADRIDLSIARDDVGEMRGFSRFRGKLVGGLGGLAGARSSKGEGKPDSERGRGASPAGQALDAAGEPEHDERVNQARESATRKIGPRRSSGSEVR